MSKLASIDLAQIPPDKVGLGSRVVVEDQDPADVAAQLGLSVNAVYVAKARVLARLRTELRGLMEL